MKGARVRLGRVMVMVLLVCIAPACGGDEETEPGVAIEVEEFPEQSAELNHVSGDVDYEQTPPVSGPHNPQSLPCEAFDESVPEEVMVHTLEHGAVGILFDPGLATAEKDAIGEYVEGTDDKVFSAPFEDLPEPVTVVSWRRMMTLESFDAAAVDEYVERYQNDAPENIVECP